MNRKRKVILGGLAGLLGICILCGLVTRLSSLTPSGRATSTARSLTQTAQPTRTTRPTATPRPTRTARPTNTPQPSPTQTASPTISPTPTETPTLSAAFELVNLSSPVIVGDYASARIRTLPGASCSIVYITPGGSISSADGLGNQTADENGICFWAWNIGPNTSPGQGSVRITANGLTQTYPIEIK